MAFYGRPRNTEDVDLWVKPTEENVGRLVEALAGFGLPVMAESFRDFFTKDNQMIVLGAKPQALDLLNRVTGLMWEESWAGSADGEWEGPEVEVSLIGRLY